MSPDWPAEWLYRYEERWAIRHFDGGMSEADARAAALAEVWAEWQEMKKRPHG